MDYYELLEISRNASEEVIKNAYRALAKKYHPDSAKEDSEFVEKKMREINEAYEVLSDKEKRAVYDLELNQKEALEKEKNQIKEQESSNYVSTVNNADQKIKNEEKIKSREQIKKEQRKKAIIISLVVFFAVALITFIIVSILVEPATIDKKQEKLETVENDDENVNKTIKNNNIKEDKNYDNDRDYNIKNYNDDEIVNNKEDLEKQEEENDTIIKIY